MQQSFFIYGCVFLKNKKQKNQREERKRKSYAKRKFRTFKIKGQSTQTKSDLFRRKARGCINRAKNMNNVIRQSIDEYSEPFCSAQIRRNKTILNLWHGHGLYT